MQIGDKISFGDYEWRVLDIQNNTALIIAEYIIEQRPFHNEYKDITWADCALRKYLNGEFYDKFTAADQARIIPTMNKNLNNQWYGTKGGEDTSDKIFLLSIEEAVCHYFGDSSSNLYHPRKNKRYWFERKDTNNSKRSTGFACGNGNVWWWWLRSPGRAGVKLRMSTATAILAFKVITI